MKKRNLGFTRNFIKLIGATLAASLLLSVNVHAEEVEELDNSEDIATISDGIDTLDEKVDSLNDNCQDEGVSDEISGMSSLINILNETISRLSMDYSKLLLTIDRNKYSIINGLNKSVYANNKISENASYSDFISKINDIKYQGTLDIAPDDNGKYTFESGYYEGGTIDISAIVEAARQEAREEGYKVGKEDGLKEGSADGDKNGYSRGLADGDKAGYSRGLADGKKQGEAAGKDFMMTNNATWISPGRSSSLSISPYITYKSYKYFYIKNTVTNGKALNSNDVVRLWIKSEDAAWGRMMVDTPITSGVYVGDGWYRFGVSEGISMVELVNKNDVPRDYVYHFSD